MNARMHAWSHGEHEFYILVLIISLTRSLHSLLRYVTNT